MDTNNTKIEDSTEATDKDESKKEIVKPAAVAAPAPVQKQVAATAAVEKQETKTPPPQIHAATDKREEFQSKKDKDWAQKHKD